MTKWLTLAAATALVGCAHAPRATSGPPLDALLSFADPAACEPGEMQHRLLGMMVTGNADEGFGAGRIDVAAEYADAFGLVYLQRHEHYTLVGVPVQGSLFGLPLVAIEQSLPKGGDPGERHYRFRSSPAIAENALVARGVPAEAGRLVTIGPPDGYELFIELVADPRYPGHALLTCGYQ